MLNSTIIIFNFHFCFNPKPRLIHVYIWSLNYGQNFSSSCKNPDPLFLNADPKHRLPNCFAALKRRATPPVGLQVISSLSKIIPARLKGTLLISSDRPEFWHGPSRPWCMYCIMYMSKNNHFPSRSKFILLLTNLDGTKLKSITLTLARASSFSLEISTCDFYWKFPAKQDLMYCIVSA